MPLLSLKFMCKQQTIIRCVMVMLDFKALPKYAAGSLYIAHACIFQGR